MHQTLITLTKYNFGVYVVFMINLDQILWPTLYFLQFAVGNDACYTLEFNTKSIKKSTSQPGAAKTKEFIAS